MFWYADPGFLGDFGKGWKVHYIIVILSGLSGMYESHQLFFERYVIFWIYLAMDFQSLLDETFTQLAQLTASIW